MRLLELDPDRVSLEFAAKEWSAIVRRLRLAGQLETEERADHDLVHVGNESLVLMNDWDHPCLISRSPVGDALLRGVAEVLSRPRRTIASPERRSAA